MILQFQPPVIAHRGGCAYAPENTMISFVKMAQLGIKWIECDVTQAACGELIIFHDQILDRTTNGKGDVDRYSYSYLQSLDAGSWFDPIFSGEKIPTLDAALEFLQTVNMHINIEIKALPEQEDYLTKRIAQKIMSRLGKETTNILFSSFSVAALYALRRHLPQCQLGLLLHEWQSDWKKIYDSLNCVSVHVDHKIMSAEIATQIKNENKILLCYTVNEPQRAIELYSWGVDAVFSDIPDQIASLL
ncbi:MAG TPA: glycerophosphoryl diester phosphodiesterase [Gammaproteobacteria bacterium]|nr:glycerophosphoryl diester phosphodiesterase [Gammaproteobacteria bacterium]